MTTRYELPLESANGPYGPVHPIQDVAGPVIALEGVAKTYPGASAHALRDISLTVLPGEFVFLVGRSGSGKSTLLRLLLGDDTPSEGRVRVLGADVATLSRTKVAHLRRRIGCVFQDFRLLSSKTAFDNVGFALQVTGHDGPGSGKRIMAALGTVGLASKLHSFPEQLSGGEQQRVAIARALVNDPALLIADEPTGNLDPASTLSIVRLLDQVHRSGTAVVMATHDPSLVDAMRRRVVEVDGGRIIRDEARGRYLD